MRVQLQITNEHIAHMQQETFRGKSLLARKILVLQAFKRYSTFFLKLLTDKKVCNKIFT